MYKCSAHGGIEVSQKQKAQSREMSLLCAFVFLPAVIARSASN